MRLSAADSSARWVGGIWNQSFERSFRCLDIVTLHMYCMYNVHGVYNMRPTGLANNEHISSNRGWLDEMIAVEISLSESLLEHIWLADDTEQFWLPKGAVISFIHNILDKFQTSFPSQ